MVFSSYLFLFYFLPATLGVYYASPKNWRLSVLTVLSYLFYGWTNPLYVPLMCFSTIVDYVSGLVIASESKAHGNRFLQPGGPRTSRQRAALVVSVVSNLALLAYFKYFQFGIDSYQALMRALGLPELMLDAVWQITLPLGISFYTFQSLSYTIDLYRGEARPARSFLDFACYVSLFPQLVAGPIIRFQDLADQLIERTHTWNKFGRGVILFELGLAKKVVLANSCGFLAEQTFNAGSLEFMQAWWGLLAYSLQIYFDFSGYSDMAIGLGLMFGFTFPENFNSPYCAVSLADFWRRWHISLSIWLREYLYIPLGGNRRGPMRTYLNLFIVMVLGGLWHGAAWNFLVWGGYHGLLLALERLVTKLLQRSSNANRPATILRVSPENSIREESALNSLSPISSSRPNRLLPRVRGLKFIRVLLTFVLVAWGWVFFRAHDLVHAGHYFQALFGFSQVQPPTQLLWIALFPRYHVLCVTAAVIIVWTAPTAWKFSETVTLGKTIWAKTLFLFSIVLLALQQYNPFIYFLF